MTTVRSDFQWKRNVSVWRAMLFPIILIWLLSLSCNNNALQHVWQTFGNFHCKRAVDLLWQAYVEATPPVFCINAFPVFGKTHHNLLVNDQGVILSRFVWPLDTSFESCFLQNAPPEMPKMVQMWPHLWPTGGIMGYVAHLRTQIGDAQLKSRLCERV